jgi:F0F1-type ATP synthase assembly protein I
MLKVISLQVAVLALLAVVVTVCWSGHEAVAVIIGGSSYLVPNLVFILLLGYASKRGRASVVTFIAGELFKATATIMTLVFVQRTVNLNWLAMLGGLFAVLQANFFAFLLKS